MSSRLSTEACDSMPCDRQTGSPAASLAASIKAKAMAIGFSACGFARAGRVSHDTEARLRRWLADGGNADMEYMANHVEKRCDPRLLMPGVKTIVSVALNYAPARTLPDGEPQMSAYALGKDYHDVVKQKLRQLADFALCRAERHGIEVMADDADRLSQPSDTQPYRIFVDTAPVLERYWAVQAGLGWIGKNHQLIIPHAGSMFFLGELFLAMELPCDSVMPSRCGTCHRCVDACPTQAIADGQASFSSSRCLSYQTIENRGELSARARAGMGDTFYGCDRCQAACPWNRFAKPNSTPELQPSDELLHMTRDKWKNLTVEEYRRLFKGSAVKRAKYDGLMRNIRNLHD